MTSPLRLGTRGSPLALWQANHVANLLRAAESDRPVELVEIQTAGDQVRDVPLAAIGGQGVFTKEIQRALQDSEVDVAVHSLKDVPTFAVDGVVLVAVPKRGPAGDAFVSSRHHSFDDLPPDAVVATSSLRRRAQILHRRPDLKVVDIRGNVETRLRKLEEQDLDALILAQAGLERLGLNHRITAILSSSWMLPAVGQGALGLECRADDTATQDLLARIDHAPTHQAVLAERSLLRELCGGCQVPIGAASRHLGTSIRLRGAVLDPRGRQRIEAESEGPSDSPEMLGQFVAGELLSLGAGAILSGGG